MIKQISFLIIGAGPAGLAAAIAYGRGATVLESNSEAGKKLMLSGSGQCNFTNNLSHQDFITACRSAGPFLKPAFYQCDNDFLIDFLAEADCPSYIREDGKVFPASLKAVQVRDALLKTALKKGAEIIYNSRVLAVAYEQETFVVKTEAITYHTSKLLIATGGSSWQQTGSKGDGYSFALALGHTLSPIRPALASVQTTQQDYFVDCAGSTVTQLKAEFLSKHGKHKDTADLLFTHQGLSGPLILNNSHFVQKGDTIRLHLVPQAETTVIQALKDSPQKIVLNALKALPLTEATLSCILHYLGIDTDTPVKDLSKKQINQIIGYLQAADFTIKSVESLDTSMSTAGGVLLKEVKSTTMESRIKPGLFLAGEVLDYALPTGGFNIQMAFSTGWLAGFKARN